MSMKTLTRLSYIDILKIVATFAIVLWHVSAVYVRMDAALLSPFGALPYVINLCVRFALPMFMMISGALLLRESYAFNFKQKFSYIIKLYAVWSLVYVLADQAMRAASGGALLSPAEMLASWIRGPYHFWYLQMLLGVYLLMPLLVRLKGLQTLNYATLLLFVIIYIYNPLSPYLPQAVNDVAGQVILYAAEHDALFHARRCLSAPRAALAQAGDPFGAGGAGWLCDPALPALQHAGLRLGEHCAAALQLQ